MHIQSYHNYILVLSMSYSFGWWQCVSVSPPLSGACLSPSWRMKGWAGPHMFLHGMGHPCSPILTPPQHSRDETPPALANHRSMFAAGTAAGGGWVMASLKRWCLLQMKMHSKMFSKCMNLVFSQQQKDFMEGYCESQHRLITIFNQKILNQHVDICVFTMLLKQHMI